MEFIWFFSSFFYWKMQTHSFLEKTILKGICLFTNSSALFPFAGWPKNLSNSKFDELPFKARETWIYALRVVIMPLIRVCTEYMPLSLRTDTSTEWGPLLKYGQVQSQFLGMHVDSVAPQKAKAGLA